MQMDVQPLKTSATKKSVYLCSTPMFEEFIQSRKADLREFIFLLTEYRWTPHKYRTGLVCTEHHGLLIPLLLLCDYKTKSFVIKYSVTNCPPGVRSWLITLLLGGDASPGIQSKEGSCAVFQIRLMNASNFSTCQEHNKFLKGLCLLSTDTHGAISQVAGLVRASFLPACSGLPTPWLSSAIDAPLMLKGCGGEVWGSRLF